MATKVDGYMTDQGQFVKTEPEAIYIENAEKFYEGLKISQNLSDPVLRVLHELILSHREHVISFLQAVGLMTDLPKLSFEEEIDE